MTEEKEMEDENLNQEEQEAGDNQEAGEKTTFTLKEVEEIKRKMQSDGEKGVQKLIKTNKAYKETYKHLSAIADKPEYLIDLFNENEDVAQIILDEYYPGKSIEDYKEDIGYQADYSNPETIKQMIKEEAEKISNKKDIEKIKKAFIDKLKLSDEEKKSFEEAFEERKSLKSFSFDNLEKHLEKAYFEIADIEQLEKIRKEGIVGNAMAKVSGKSTTSKNVDTKKMERDKEIDDFNKKFNL